MDKSKIKNLFWALIVAALALALCVAFPYGATQDLAFVADSYGGSQAESLWYYQSNALGLYEAKEITDGWKQKLEGTDPVVIAVVDTGITAAHELFDGVLLKNAAGEVLGDNSTVADGAGTVDISDTSSGRHGNAVAGVIAMLIHELGLEDLIKIYPIKASKKSTVNGQTTDSFSIESVTEAIKRSVSKAEADVVNLSFGRQFSETDKWASDASLAFAVQQATTSALIVAAAGNNSKKSDADPFYPAALDGIFSVMGYDESGDLYDTSNYGMLYDIAAPAEKIYTAYDTSGTGSSLKSSYSDDHSGTSMAAPMVSFAAALLKLRCRAEGLAEPDPLTLASLLRSFDFDSFTHGGADIRKLSLSVLVGQPLDEVEINYSAPTSVKISHDAALGTGENADVIYYEDPRDVPTINFVANLTPYGQTDPDWNDQIVWVLRDAKGVEIELGRGRTLSYKPSVYGETQLIARLSYKVETQNVQVQGVQKINVKYLKFIAADARVTYERYANSSPSSAPTSGVLYTGETTVFTVTGINFLDPNVEIKWYVDRVYVASGRTFAYTPATSGEHVISMQYGDEAPTHIPGVAFVANVKPFILRPLDLAMLTVGCAVVLAAATTLIVIAAKRKQASKNKNRSD